MKIRKATIADLDTMMAIYAGARAFMAENGNPTQWGSSYPARELLEADLAAGYSYLCMDGEETAAVFYFGPGPDPTYAVIEDGQWENDMPYWVVHRIAANGRRRGVASFCLDWCFEQCGHLRIDTHADNLPMQKVLAKNGFARCGIIHLENGAPRIAYEKTK